MQQIERYGVIALVFLLVTIVAVSFWGDNKSPGFWSRLTGRGEAKKVEIARNAATSERAVEGALPLTANPPLGPIDATQPMAPAAAPAPAAVPAPVPTAESAIAHANAPAGTVYVPGNTQAPINTAIPQSSPGLVAIPAPVQPQPKSEPAPARHLHTAPSAASSVSSVEYVVQKGDSLASIAQKTLGSSSRWTEIQSLNGGIQPKSLRVGTKLKLPATATARTTIEKPKSRTESPSPKKTAPAASSDSAGSVYVVRAGDTLSTIAEKKLGSADRWKEIVAVNPGLDPHKLFVGKSLKLPADESRAIVAAVARPSSASNSGKPHVR